MPTEHLTDDALELCALDRLSETDAAPVEEHLLVCDECLARMAECEAYVAAMRAALRPSGTESH